MKNLLNAIYGSSSRSVQVFNIAVNLVFGVLCGLNLLNVAIISLPVRLERELHLLICFCTLAVALQTIAFTAFDYRKSLLKACALLVGGLVQAIIASFYVSMYPPFEPMMIVCLCLSLWFIGAVLYISSVEGVNECRT